MNSKAIADAIAARFVGITATFGSQTEALAATPTASLPNTIALGPVILVYPPTGTLGLMLRQRDDVLDFPVMLLRDPFDVPTRSDAMYAWYDAMRDQVEQQMSLGLIYVAWAHPISLRMEFDGAEYPTGLNPQAKFDVVELVVQVQFNEVVTTLGP